MKKWFTMLLCLILACAAFAAPAEEIPFATVGDAATDGAYYYYAPDYYVILVKKDGAWWRVDAQVDDRYGELYAGMYEAEDPVAADAELTAYARTLPVASAEKFSEQPLGAESLNSYAGKKMKDLLADGFGIDFVQGYTADASKTGGKPRVLRASDSSGTVYRIPLYLFGNIGSGSADGLVFKMNRGVFAYYFRFSGTEETLKAAIENGTWEEAEIIDAGSFAGFSNDLEQSLWGDVNARPLLTGEEAAAIRTVGDAEKYDFRGFYSEDYDEYYILINGTDRFWLATAKLDEEYRDMARAAYSTNNNDFRNYETALPVTVKALEAEHPPVPDTSVYAGKTIGELQAEGFRIVRFFATTADPAKEEFNKILLLPDASGNTASVKGFFSYDDYNEYCQVDVEKGMYSYTCSFDGTAETLEAALRDGTFPNLTVREMTYSGISEDALTTLGLR